MTLPSKREYNAHYRLKMDTASENLSDISYYLQNVLMFDAPGDPDFQIQLDAAIDSIVELHYRLDIIRNRYGPSDCGMPGRP